MSAQIIDGKKISQDLLLECKQEGEKMLQKGVKPSLVVIRVGEDPASEIYVRKKQQTCLDLGFHSEEIHLEDSIDEARLLKEVQSLNANKKVHGILVQLPLPAHIQTTSILEAVDPKKDVDCFHPFNVGKLLIGEPVFAPCTPAGILELLRRSAISPKGKHVVILGRSNIVGKPMAALLIRKGVDATVTICHSRTENLSEMTRQGDILVAAIGQAEFVKKEMVKPGAVVIDVGMNRIEDPAHPGKKKLVGDVDFSAVQEVASFITPVPGGVGPMTIAMLLSNTVHAAKLQSGL